MQPLAPAGIELSLTAAADIEGERARVDEHWRAEPARAGYGAWVAERSDRAVDLENALVGRMLELRWQDALRQQGSSVSAGDMREGSAVPGVATGRPC